MQGHILSCTFCKRSEQQVRKLVAGPGVYICDRCTERAHAIIATASRGCAIFAGLSLAALE